MPCRQINQNPERDPRDDKVDGGGGDANEVNKSCSCVEHFLALSWKERSPLESCMFVVVPYTQETW